MQDFMGSEQESFPTLKKHHLCFILIQVIPSKEQSDMPILCHATLPLERRNSQLSNRYLL